MSIKSITCAAFVALARGTNEQVYTETNRSVTREDTAPDSFNLFYGAIPPACIAVCFAVGVGCHCVRRNRTYGVFPPPQPPREVEIVQINLDAAIVDVPPDQTIEV